MKYNVDKRKLLYVTNRNEWRAWLEKHHKTEKEIRLVYYKKNSGKPRISYNDAKANKKAWKHFKTFSDPYIRIRIAFIDAARKRPEIFEKRLKYFIKMTEKNKQYGFGGIDKYFK